MQGIKKKKSKIAETNIALSLLLNVGAAPANIFSSWGTLDESYIKNLLNAGLAAF